MVNMKLVRQDVKDIQLSIRHITALAAKKENCIRFDIGQPEFDVPNYIKESAIAAMKEKHGYSPFRGYENLREAIVKYESWKNLDLSMENVTVTTGGMGGLAVLFLTTLEPGEEIIVSKPFWSAYSLPITLARGKLKPVEMKPGLEQLKNVVSDKTKFIVVNSPNNPSGEVYSKSLLQEIAKFAREEDIYLLSDEVYDRIIFEGEHHSIAKFAPERTFILNSTSKTFAMTGWRLGWLIGPSEEMVEIAKGNRGTVACPNSIAMIAAHTALSKYEKVGQYEVNKMVKAYQKRSTVIEQRMKQLGWELPYKPTGALYAFPKCCEDSWGYALKLIDEVGVSTVPGVPFGTEGHLRFCFGSVAVPDIHKAFDRIENL